MIACGEFLLSFAITIYQYQLSVHWKMSLLFLLLWIRSRDNSKLLYRIFRWIVSSRIPQLGPIGLYALCSIDWDLVRSNSRICKLNAHAARLFYRRPSICILQALKILIQYLEKIIMFGRFSGDCHQRCTTQSGHSQDSSEVHLQWLQECCWY